jgi:hypothetical protein
MFGWVYTFGDYDRDEIGSIEEALEAEAIKFNENSVTVNIYMFT